MAAREQKQPETEKKPAVKKKSADFEQVRRGNDRWYHLVFPIVKFFFNLVHPLKIEGRENIPQGAALVCPNHTALNDPVIAALALGWHNPMRAMAKQELLDVPVLGKICSALGVFGVKRGQADTKAIMTAIRYLKAGDKLVMFPEGTRVAEGEDQEAKNGVGMLSLKTGAPIVPVYIEPKKRWFRFTHVVIGTPFYPTSESKRPTAADYSRIGDQWKQQVKLLEGQARG
jgi:1-acyl-sn-glycerol-3-phosphate acyltransferase